MREEGVVNLERDGAPDIPVDEKKCCETCEHWVTVDGSVGICALAAKALSEARKGVLYAMAECISQCDHCCGRWEPWRGL